jgi:CheY-like chemotaxis protein/KaiC/GvpD/RAD55 family RecA-like ATPase
MPEKKQKILLADDEINIRLLGEKLLKEAGYDVVLASDGLEAISKAISEKPDLVITDIRMPKKTGFEVCKALRSDPVLSKVPILILSSLGDEFNKLTGFEGGANDFLTKPFRADELKERISFIFERGSKAKQGSLSADTLKGQASHADVLIPSGIEGLDNMLGGGLPKGSNILLAGPLGKGKSTFAKRFISNGLSQGEKCLYLAVDDDPAMIRSELNKMPPSNVLEQENNNMLRFIDAYTWASGEKRSKEKFKVSGVLTLDQLADLISKAGSDIGQTIQQKHGGRRVIDSISSLFVNFELPAVQLFLSQVSRTAMAFGGVTTLFVIEEGSVSEQTVNNIKYAMDGVIEFSESSGSKVLRVTDIKWIKFNNDWIPW